jgi:hypothetical protein
MRLTEDEYNALISRRKPALAESPESGGARRAIRQSRREPNKTERRFEQEYLKPMLMSGQIDRCGEHESIRLKIANGLTYTPDWPTWKDGRLQFWEIKGARLWDDAIVKLKIAARAYPDIDFCVCQWKGGIWIIQPIWS